MSKQNAVFNWSGGKDSSLCLHKVLASGEYNVTHLLTTVNAHYQRISMHGVRVELLEQQADSIGIPLVKVLLPEMPDMPTYESIMRETLVALKSGGAQNFIFGDIFLEDLRQYRIDKLAEMDLQAVFPIWKVPTDQLVREFIDLGFKAVIVCVNDRYLDRSFAGRTIDQSFLDDLPLGVDPCGENGEYHSFVYDGPIFSRPIAFDLGEVVYRKYTPPETSSDTTCDPGPLSNGFWYSDLVPAAVTESHA
jgi:uncharacterized protein (TIGR00290 family)